MDEKLTNNNNLSNNNLSIGQILKIPSTTNYITYTVKKDDSLDTEIENLIAERTAAKASHKLTGSAALAFNDGKNTA